MLTALTAIRLFSVSNILNFFLTISPENCRGNFAPLPSKTYHLRHGHKLGNNRFGKEFVMNVFKICSLIIFYFISRVALSATCENVSGHQHKEKLCFDQSIKKQISENVYLQTVHVRPVNFLIKNNQQRMLLHLRLVKIPPLSIVIN